MTKYKPTSTTSTFITVGALSGLIYTVIKNKPLWVTAGSTILCAIAGAVLGSFYEKIRND